MLFVDTNIFLEYLLNQERASEVESFLESTWQNNERLVCSHFSIHSIEIALARNKKFSTLETFLTNVERSPHLFVYSTTVAEEKEVVQTALKTSLSFDDAMQYHVAKKTGCDTIVSFDQDFDKTDLKRKTPKEALK